MSADFYEVDLCTIENCLSANENELHNNGYRVLTGKELKEFKLRYVQDIDVPNKTPQIGFFDFRSFLNIGMLLTESEKAKWVRSKNTGIGEFHLIERGASTRAPSHFKVNFINISS